MEVGLGCFSWPCLPLQLSSALLLPPTPKVPALSPWVSTLVYLPSLLPLPKQETPWSENSECTECCSAGKYPERPDLAIAGFNCLLKVGS